MAKLPLQIKVLVWNIKPEQFPTKPGDISALDVDYTVHPDLFEHLGDGWDVVSHHVETKETGPQLTLLLTRPNIGGHQID